MTKTVLTIAAVSGFLAVALGAFGAHALKDALSPAAMAVYKTAVQYQMFHTSALLAIGLLLLKFPLNRALLWSGYLMIAGMLLFSGSLYALSMSGARWLGMLTPVGGVLMLGGWLLLAFAARKFIERIKPHSN